MLEPRSAAVPSSFRLPGRRSIRAVSSRLYVSLYLGLLSFELPFRENLSEGSVLFIEYFLCSISGGLIVKRWFRGRIEICPYRLR